MSNIVNQIPYLRTSREFPEEIRQLTIEINKSYIDIANTVNNRTISLFPTNRPAINGESYFLNNNQRQQALRQVYTFAASADIPLGFKISTIHSFSKPSGSYTDGTHWYGAIYASSVAIPGQLAFFVFQDIASTTTDLIRFTVGAGSPAIVRGIIILEWISNP